MPVRKIALAPDAMQPVTLEQAKQHCRIDCADEDMLVSSFILAATQSATDRLQRSLVPTRYRLSIDKFPPVIELLLPPIISVESVKYIDANGIQQTLDPNAYWIDSTSEPGRLLPANGDDWPATQERANAVEVEYTAGYPGSTIPEPIKAWILLAVGDLYEQRSRSAEKPVVPQIFAESLLDTYRIWSL